MNAYKIRMNIEIVPCHDSPSEDPVLQEDGSVQITLAEPDALNIDTCERALLQTAYPALRKALSTHFSEVSKKKPVSMRERERS